MQIFAVYCEKKAVAMNTVKCVLISSENDLAQRCPRVLATLKSTRHAGFYLMASSF